MRMIVPLSLLAVMTIAGCGEAQTPTPQDVQTGQAEGLPPMADPPQPPAPPGGEAVPVPGAAPTVLEPIVRADWQGRLEPGSGCNLSMGGQEYVVATVGDAVAKIDGEVVDLTGVPEDFNAVVRGGRFEGGGAAVEIVLAPDLGEGSVFEETFTKPVRVTVTSGGTTERFDAGWTCGS